MIKSSPDTRNYTLGGLGHQLAFLNSELTPSRGKNSQYMYLTEADEVMGYQRNGKSFLTSNWSDILNGQHLSSSKIKIYNRNIVKILTDLKLKYCICHVIKAK